MKQISVDYGWIWLILEKNCSFLNSRRRMRILTYWGEWWFYFSWPSFSCIVSKLSFTFYISDTICISRTLLLILVGIIEVWEWVKLIVWNMTSFTLCFCRSKMCSQDGPPLCLGGELCWSTQLQVFSSFLGNMSFLLT